MSDFKPYVAANKEIREFTPRAAILGLVFGFFFAIANGYLALKIGQTVSASIPAAILSMAFLKFFFKGSTILENNIVQTIATVGEGLAAGVVFTIPALIVLGETPSIGRIFLLSALGGILGILFMIPMRRFLIVEEHKKLPYPEGTACAEILKAGAERGQGAILALWGIVVAAVYKVCSNALFLWNESYTWTAKFFRNAEFTIDATPALLGVGYIIGPRISSFMFSGGLIAWWVLIPLIKIFGTGNAAIYPAESPIEAMSSDTIWNSYIRYIGAGAIAVGGLMSLFKVIPLLHKTIHTSFKELFSGAFLSRTHLPRTDRDISMAWLLLGSVAIILLLWLLPELPMNFLTIFLLVILAFCFVAVTSVTTGLVGTSSNPVSGMTILILLITCIIFVLLGWTERLYLISAITMGCVACCAVCIGSTTSHDLKTGYLVGATPKSQQIAEILGAFIPALTLGYVVYILNAAYHIGSAQMPAPQATLLALIAQGVISGDLPYVLFGVGIMIGVVLAVLRIPILPVAIGVYLPLSISTATMVGGLARAYVNSKNADESAGQRGILLAAGLVGGDACVGIIIALLTVAGAIPITSAAKLPDLFTLGAFLVLAFLLAHFSQRKRA
jgi:putative OPT family oligopeptide transporter